MPPRMPNREVGNRVIFSHSLFLRFNRLSKGGGEFANAGCEQAAWKPFVPVGVTLRASVSELRGEVFVLAASRR